MRGASHRAQGGDRRTLDGSQMGLTAKTPERQKSEKREKIGGRSSQQRVRWSYGSVSIRARTKCLRARTRKFLPSLTRHAAVLVNPNLLPLFWRFGVLAVNPLSLSLSRARARPRRRRL